VSGIAKKTGATEVPALVRLVLPEPPGFDVFSVAEEGEQVRVEIR
jgi:hypothetical protein